MPIHFHPNIGTILICDFDSFTSPEMTKRRPAVVVSPRFRTRDQLCTVVPLSTSRPKSVCEYHCTLAFDPPMPKPFDSPEMWAKADMLYTVGFQRLSPPFAGKDDQGKRMYDIRQVTQDQLKTVQKCILYGLGLDP